MINAGAWLALALTIAGAGIVAAALLPDRRTPAIVAWAGSAAAVPLAVAGGMALLSGWGGHVRLWEVPGVGTLTVAMDSLTAVFLCVAALVFLPVSVFSAGYLPRYLGRYSLRSFGVLYLALFISVTVVLVAADVLLFLLAWEVMAVLSYLLVNYEHERAETVQAGFIMLAMGEAGILAAALAFLLLAVGAGGIDFASLRGAASGLGAGVRWAVFLLSFAGFGVKAGLVPLSSWLPRAYPAAPANVSALLSSLIVNLGVYGIVRVNVDLLPASGIGHGPGVVVLGIGALSALTGILYATTQNDLKTMLAHSSIENLGIVAAGLGAGLLFAAEGRVRLAAIADVVALYHMGNHALYKALLFLGVGVVDAQVGERNMDRLGGLIRRMPRTAAYMLIGSLAIAAMPPSNGFVSEWLTLQTLLRSAEIASAAVKVVFALGGAALALTAALAVTCFVKAFAMTFLGVARSEGAAAAGEAPRVMTVPLAWLAVICGLAGILPTYVIPALGLAVRPVAGVSVADALVPPFFPDHPVPALPASFVAEFHDLGAQLGRGAVPGRGLVVLLRGGTQNPVVFAMSTAYMVVILALLLGAAAATVWLVARARAIARRPCWDGGLPRLVPGMTYTATGFSNPVRVVFRAVFHPAAPEDTVEVVARHFRTAVRRPATETYIVDRVIAAPLARAARAIAGAVAAMHHGRLNTYAAYVLLTLLAFLLIGWLR